MKDFYLLAAGLLTGVVIPASTIPQLSVIQAKNSGVLWNLEDNTQHDVGGKIVPSVDLSIPSVPEFSNNQILSKPILSKPTESSFHFNTQPTYSRRPVSGRQLYHQRLLELKSSQTHTNFPNERLQSLLIAANKSQLTYEDWKSLLSLEAQAMARGQGKNSLGILLGDSLSLWFPQESLPSDRLWLNQGISGDTSGGIVKRLSAFSATKPDVIYVMAGINDLRRGLTDEVILRNHRKMLRSLRESHPHAKIFVQSILPTRLPNIPNKRVRNINHHLALIAKQENAYYLNLYQWFIDFRGNLREELTTDGLHLSREGYEVWQSALRQVEFKLSSENKIYSEESIVNSQ
ncbi:MULTISPECIES: SGNH/GDSL hydrolase family protein [Nostocales]|uniref:Lipolytic protein G-D-S-L family n=2 Tax=Nostocales TaxID=1161 RepID=A0A0C1QYQ8_9CYAN|nr:SGNH/GDSL hydrolase family protein [Tolypothrix bouteillei]KAF3886641.1 lipolytic protein G-D-S-L family [Tolypothrix bouteillei VB521301]